MRDRVWRRHQRDRVKTRIERWLREWHYRYYDWDEREELVQKEARQRLDARAPCSCWMCGNPRKWFRDLTMDEKIANLQLGDDE